MAHPVPPARLPVDDDDDDDDSVCIQQLGGREEGWVEEVEVMCSAVEMAGPRNGAHTHTQTHTRFVRS